MSDSTAKLLGIVLAVVVISSTVLVTAVFGVSTVLETDSDPGKEIRTEIVYRTSSETGSSAATPEPSTPIETEVATSTESRPKDSDNDGLTDKEEREIGTDPHDPDTDGDGLLDGWEVKGVKPRPGCDVEHLERVSNPLHTEVNLQITWKTSSRDHNGVFNNVQEQLDDAPVENKEWGTGLTTGLHFTDGSLSTIEDSCHRGLYYFILVVDDVEGGYGDTVNGDTVRIEKSFIYEHPRKATELLLSLFLQNALGEDNPVDPGPDAWNQIDENGLKGLPKLENWQVPDVDIEDRPTSSETDTE